MLVQPRDERGAHPRVCGENLQQSQGAVESVGSSPRVRGKRDHHRAHRRPRRLIPACAGKTCRVARVPRRTGAHPRVCGENSVPGLARERGFGSSPRVRGKRVRAVADGGGARLIPACAGKTPPTSGTSGPRTAHPRVCGENIGRRGVADVQRGSSPRVRGKPAGRRGCRVENGLIPACAGKTRSRASSWTARRAHPRVCGENLREVSLVAVPAGSSPRVRGKRARMVSRRYRCGLIPACAGKTHQGRHDRRLPTAHPRVCGENNAGAMQELGFSGSSPRVRGKPSASTSCPPTRRLIPACAGKTPTEPAATRSKAAHPRVCGENGSPGDRMPLRAGSSPRVRGKPTSASPYSTTTGLIPACAGKTNCTSGVPPRTGAHPRVCGENPFSTSMAGRGMGSSPRVRGKLLVGEVCSGLRRLIPACAGKTWGRHRELPPRPGSSPRVRGKLGVGEAHGGVDGLIPACAGKT